MNPSEAILTVLTGMESKIPKAEGGVIAITKDGNVGFNWNSDQLARAYVKKNEMTIHYGVNRGEDFTQPFEGENKHIENISMRTIYLVHVQI